LRSSILLTLIYSTVIFLIIIQPLHAQSNGNINFSADNEKLSSVLYRLANESEINFSYDSADSIFNTKITYNAVDKQPLIILDELLSNTSHAYKQVGNQIVIYSDRNKSQSSGKESIQNTVNNSNSVVVIPVNENISVEPITDTIIINDTIVKVQIDTVVVTDTVFIEKEKPKKPPTTKIKDIPVDYFNPSASREKGWSAAIFIAPIISDFSLTRQTDAWNVRNYSFGIDVTKVLNRWNISGGLKFTHFGEKYNHNYIVSDGGYFVTDTIDEYYTVSSSDTTWYYVTDSTYKPIDSHEYSYDINNRIGYLEFVVSASFDYYSNRNLRLYIKGGMQAGTLIYSSGIAIPDANEPASIDFADLNFSTFSYSFLVGTGIKYRINEYFDFNSELYYFKYFNDVVIDYPMDKKIRGVGLKFGLIYYF